MIVSCHRSLFSVFIVYPSSAPKTRRSLKDCCHSFISVPLSTCHLFIYLYISPHSSSDLGVRRWVRGLWEALKIVYVSLRWIARLLKERSLVELHLFQFKTFFVFLWRTVSPSVLVLLFFLLFLNSALLPLLNFAGPCRRWGRRTRAFTPSPCISKESESAVAKAQGEYNIIRHKQDKAFSFSMHR